MTYQISPAVVAGDIVYGLKIPVGRHSLINGPRAKTRDTLRDAFSYTQGLPHVRANYLDASQIQTSADFFLPLLEHIHGDDAADFFDPDETFRSQFARIGLDLSAPEGSPARRVPVIFVAGLEQLLFQFDYPGWTRERFEEHKAQMKEQKVMGRAKHPVNKQFGSSFRGTLLQKSPSENGAGILVGTVWDDASVAYEMTLGTPHYQLYAQNFAPYELPEDKNTSKI